MISIGEQILEKENKLANIAKLAAMREVYARGKDWILVYTILALIGVLILAPCGFILKRLYAIDISWLVALYGITLFALDTFIIKRQIKLLKTKAASIQEQFDCEVLIMGWNKMLFSKKPEDTDVPKYSEFRIKRMKGKKKLDKFKNWYKEPIKKVAGNSAKLICQRSNIAYDMEVRNSFLKSVLIVSWGIFILLAVLAFLMELSIGSFIINAVSPFLPIFSITTKWHYEQKDTIQTLKDIKNVVENEWDFVISTVTEPDDTTIRQIQDRIHLHRKTSPLVPDIIYDMLRNKNEKYILHSVNEQVQEYLKSRGIEE
ncbi:MAG TPA: hypothetical protein DCS93_39780 [Microscillaceae bacterium]|nr:hypothetical protein [Microscillaceae bacterium]